MTDFFTSADLETFQDWQRKIAIADRHNIFCHCHNCGAEWVDSHLQVSCSKCKSDRVEKISCWQFPDD